MRKTALLFLAIPLTFTAACGSSPDGTGGSPGTGGGGSASTSSTTTSTSSGIVAPGGSGAFTLTTTQPDPTTCPIAGNTAALGQIDAANRTMLVSDGADIILDCTVKGTGSFEVHTWLDDSGGSGNFFAMTIPSITPAASQSAPAQGSLEFSSPWTAGMPYSGDCSFYFTPGTPETVAAGKIWVTFTCPGLTSGQSSCPLQIGYAIFESCRAE